MPALPAVPKVLQLKFQTTNADDGYVNVNGLHFAYTGVAPSPAQLASFATTCLTAFGSALAPAMSNQKTISGLVAIDLDSPTSATAAVTSTTVGALTGVVVPDDAAVVMSATVARRYRGGHPRSYLPLGDSTKLADGHKWISEWLNVTVLPAWSGFVTAVEGAGWAGAGTLSPVNVSYYQGFHLVTYPSLRSRDVPTLRVGGPLVDAIVGYVPRQRVGSQRRRLGR